MQIVNAPEYPFAYDKNSLSANPLQTCLAREYESLKVVCMLYIAGFITWNTTRGRIRASAAIEYFYSTLGASAARLSAVARAQVEDGLAAEERAGNAVEASLGWETAERGVLLRELHQPDLVLSVQQSIDAIVCG